MKIAVLTLCTFLVVACAKDSGVGSPASPAANPPPPGDGDQGKIADPCLSGFAGRWARDVPVMHPQVDLSIRYEAANSSLSLTFIAADGSGATVTETYVLDGKPHAGDGKNTGTSYSGACQNFAINLTQDAPNAPGSVHKTLFLDMLGLSVQTIASDRSLDFYQRYARTSLER